MSTLLILLLPWAVLGAAVGAVEFALGRWEKLGDVAFRLRIFLYGPAAWILAWVVVPALLRALRHDGKNLCAPPIDLPR